MSKITEFAASIENGMFADRDTVREAYDYALKLARGNPDLLVAVHVMMNTIAKSIKAIDRAERGTTPKTTV